MPGWEGEGPSAHTELRIGKLRQCPGLAFRSALWHSPSNDHQPPRQQGRPIVGQVPMGRLTVPFCRPWISPTKLLQAERVRRQWWHPGKRPRKSVVQQPFSWTWTTGGEHEAHRSHRFSSRIRPVTKCPIDLEYRQPGAVLSLRPASSICSAPWDWPLPSAWAWPWQSPRER